MGSPLDGCWFVSDLLPENGFEVGCRIGGQDKRLEAFFRHVQRRHAGNRAFAYAALAGDEYVPGLFARGRREQRINLFVVVMQRHAGGFLMLRNRQTGKPGRYPHKGSRPTASNSLKPFSSEGIRGNRTLSMPLNSSSMTARLISCSASFFLKKASVQASAREKAVDDKQIDLDTQRTQFLSAALGFQYGEVFGFKDENK